ncbi:hypothetical protein O987_11105 [Comamonas testosteroni TK102]|uniref:Uncharacterized protein n=1 Tax=Comamonas testosteroni TK102 TaxID=1392005 RepID=A0A076PSL7_COMTE|nr:hypothetical protein O987_11105 [Comamonas testosteroni TK102]
MSVAWLVARQPASHELGRQEQSGAAGARAQDAVQALFLRMGGGKTACWLANTMQSLAFAGARLDSCGANAAP